MRQSSFKELVRLVLHQPLRMSLMLVGTLVQVLLTVYLPILIGQAVDAVLIANGQVLLGILGKMVMVILLNTLVQWYLPLVTNRLVYGMVADLREQVYVKLHQMPLSYLDRQSVGDLVARFSSDSEQLTNGLLMIFNQFFIGISTIFLTIFTMARLDLTMMLVVVALTPVSLLVARYIAKKSYGYYRQQTQARGRQSQLLEESISQLTLVQSFNAQEQFTQGFQVVNDQYATYSQQAIFASSTVNPSTRFVNAIIYALLAGLGALRIMAGNFTVGSLTTFLNYASQYSKPFNDISSVLSELQSALACADRLFAILALDSIDDQAERKIDSEELKGAISFDNVSFSYSPERSLIEHLDIAVKAGQKVAIVGPTGAGKSTMINLLMRFYDVTAGQIVLDGVPISQYSREDLRRQIGMVLQETWIKSGTIHDNIAYGYPNATRELVIEAAKAANADFFIRQLPQGYDTVLADGGEGLSQGQRQLLSIARVFVKIPKILILDEATSSIDTRTEILVQEAFAKLMEGRTSFIIAHRLSTIQSADLILVMVDGKIVEQGNHEALMAEQGVYYQMQTSQQTEEDESVR
ncbi:TPA: ABC transporter ATP-binding protein [Streptococcus suis]|uniref:ABC transporter ATP-binding membrane protein n=4 Tax=Streptococcus suis TaxID=1307 RepID=A0A0H3N3X1_STRS4|nr:ABC transporter ATP-binding protein [Streptococcus suis]ABP92228.1 ABC-type multidrug transport system, ATPase and permease component [Streptococcus suis 98HAH33]ADE31389.1 ABC transporter related protein [Streptococcus suis GZ1]ADV70112.1 ABC-type multidrug transport system, ATPase and permease component [Streptococcus suis JS14]AER15158.1 ABC-type multidrug transport system, ATPase and permease component [Streptococcus suis SS12]AER44249.1 ABC-type multidrug transport system, ATPase and p